MLPAKVHFRSDFPVMKKQLAFHLPRNDLDVCRIASGIRVDIAYVLNHWCMNASFWQLQRPDRGVELANAVRQIESPYLFHYGILVWVSVLLLFIL